MDAHSRGREMRNAIEAAVYRIIFDDASFAIDTPKLSLELWERVSIITPASKEENERLEFLGDKLMDATISIGLYKLISDGSPHKYTVSVFPGSYVVRAFNNEKPCVGSNRRPAC
jgi:hypothetical protein